MTLSLALGAILGFVMADGHAALAAPAGGAAGARKAAAAKSDGDIAAGQLFARAQELMSNAESERGVKILETILEQYPSSPVRYKAYLGLGKYHLSNHDQVKAVGYLRNIRSIEQPDKELVGDDLDLLLEGLYLLGVANFEMRQYGAAFPVLRKIANDYPNTVWANQAYYYIGMCHFAEQNWNKAIEALSLVGTFVDPDSPTVEFVEAGQRLYVKVLDADLPVLFRLGQKVSVTAESKSGDKETIECIPLAGNDSIFIGSIPTEIGAAKAGDAMLQVSGGDIITLTYADKNDKEGKKDVPRQFKARVVSTASLSFMLGDLETRAGVAFMNQPVFIALYDADQDKTNDADKVTVRVVSRYKDEDEKAQTAALADEKGEVRYKIRDEVTVTLTEQAARELKEAGTQPAKEQPKPAGGPIHTGRFAGQVQLGVEVEGKPIDKSDAILTCAMNDEVVATYVDELHIGGEVPREITTKAIVASEIESRPHATQYVVGDPVISARKDLVEASAYLELGRIFKSMGLMKGAKEKADDGLRRVDAIIRTRSPLPPALIEEAFKAKWELELVKDDYNAAISTCEMFNRLYPESPFVDQALMGIAKVKVEAKDWKAAMDIYRRIISLPNSQIKAEAQFRIAEATEANGTPGSEAAIAQYKLVAERYRDSQFAGPSLGKLVDYYIETRDYTQANDLLAQIFQDHPDAGFLDGMLLKWVLVSFRMGDFQKAHDKCEQLLFEYPESTFAERAKAILPRIDEKMKK
ncbi:MAG: tetratricopeptide repeat protein [Planctomycetota bacterium]|nr:tetratricopeptide repeat protein [Planctomycetota bacterium]